MANGVRIKRQGGFEQTDSFRNLMKLLQAGSGIAQTVQQQRNTRATYLQNSITRIMGKTNNPKYRKGNLRD